MSLDKRSQFRIGVAHLPDQRRKIVARRGVNFTIMVCGESGVGKTTFINTLFTTTIKDGKQLESRHNRQHDRTVEIEVTKAELEEGMFKVHLTVVDTPGFGDYINNQDSWKPVIEFVDDQHESYMRQEQQPYRRNKIDRRVHACLYFIRPTGHSVSPLDIETMKRLGTRVNLIPVIAKADTLTPGAMSQFKERILQVIKTQNIKVYSCAIESDDELGTQTNRDIMTAMPFAVIGSAETLRTADGRVVTGRAYQWGVAEVENEHHCDFKKLRNLLIRSHMLDLIQATEEVHYETYRQHQMAVRKFGEPKTARQEHAKLKEKEENLHRWFTEQVKREENRFRHWEQNLIMQRDKLSADLEKQHSYVKALEAELDALYRSSMRR